MGDAGRAGESLMSRPAGYTRRAASEWCELPLPVRLGIIETEYEWAIEEGEDAKAAELRAEADHLKDVIEKLKPKEVKQDPSLPLGFHDINA